MKRPSEIEKINVALKPLALADRMAKLAENFPALVLQTTFSTEDQLITWAIVERSSNVKIQTPLSGALLSNANTLRFITQERYDLAIAANADIDPAIAIIAKCQHQKNADRSAPIITWDHKKVALTINPLADWSFTEVLHAIAEHEVPINPLFDDAITEHAKTRPHIDAQTTERKSGNLVRNITK